MDHKQKVLEILDEGYLFNSKHKAVNLDKWIHSDRDRIQEGS